jgi:hypothetical protein
VAYIDIANERVGIGTTSPTSNLHISGITQTGTQIPFRIENNTGNTKFQVNSYSGDYVLQFKNSTNVIRNQLHSNGDSYLNGGNVGIGTTTPSSKLDVSGGVTASGPVDSSDGTNASITSETARFNKYGLMANRGSMYITNEYASGSIIFGIGGTHADNPKMYLSSDGKLGISTTSPAQKLDVNGIALTKGVRAESTTDYSLITRDSGGNTVLYVQSANSNTNQPIAKFNYGSTTANSGTTVLSVGKDISYFNATNVGIGTASPSAKLDVVGLANINDSSNNVMISSGNTALTSGINNTAVGYQAALSNSTGQYNTAGGYHSMRNATSVQFNTALGSSSARNVTGNANTAVGHEASFDGNTANSSLGWRAGRSAASYNVSVGYGAASNTTGSGNTVVGYNAAVGDATSNFSNTVAVGREALNSLTIGAQNTAVGYQAGTNITEGDNNTVFGYQAGQYITTANQNSLFGRQAGQDVTGANNVGMGSLALADCVSSNNNVAIGYGAARGTSGSAPNNTVAIGYESLRNVTTANTNVAIGRSSGYSITTGGNNVLLGHESGYSLVGGAGNIFLGYQAGYNETGSDKLYINNSSGSNPLIYGDFNLREATINGDLNVSSGNLRADAIEINGRSQTSPSAGEYGAGSKIVTQFATGTVTAGVVYVASSGAWVQGDADVGSASIGMIAVATDSASAAEMLIEGVIKLSSNAGFSGASDGDVLYLSNTAGELTDTAPSGTGDYVRVCGYVVNASQHEVFFSPSKEWRVV